MFEEIAKQFRAEDTFRLESGTEHGKYAVFFSKNGNWPLVCIGAGKTEEIALERALANSLINREQGEEIEAIRTAWDDVEAGVRQTIDGEWEVYALPGGGWSKLRVGCGASKEEALSDAFLNAETRRKAMTPLINNDFMAKHGLRWFPRASQPQAEATRRPAS